jgi:diguanylate cyclase (GGDEF)-like protein
LTDSTDANDKPKVLIVDDQPDNIRVLMAALKQDCRIVAATTGDRAIELASQPPQPELILLDVMMPDMDGYDVCARLKENPATRHISIIFITALGEACNETKGLTLGAVDYIIKPANPSVVRARVGNQLTLQRLTRQLQHMNDLLEEKVNQRTQELHQALGKIKQRTEELHHAVYFHALSGLPSRAALLESLQVVCAGAAPVAKTSDQTNFVVLVINLIRFSLINNSLGHTLGDKALVAIAERFQSVLREGDGLYQIGGDEFCVLAHHLDTEADIAAYAETILGSLNRAINVEGLEIFVHARMGVVVGDPTYDNAVDVLRDADTAMQRVKSDGAEGYHIFRADLRAAAIRRLELENALNYALHRHEFDLFYQPIIDLATGQIHGFEALIRWWHPDRGLVPPVEFVTCLEDTGLIVPVGQWVLQRAMEQLQTWQQRFGAITMSVNLAARQMTHPTLLHDIDGLLAQVSLIPGTLKLEVTESGLLETGDRTLKTIQALRDRGLHISIDDFGTGYSSLGYLKQLPIDVLKIDRCFVKDIGPNGENSEIAQAIISMGDALGMTIVAEGCETQQQIDFLRQLGCQYGQGYWFAKPMPTDAATTWMIDHGQKSEAKTV